MERQLLDVIAVEARPDHSLNLTFENGEKRVFDMRRLLTKPPFHRLRESPLFVLATVGC